MLADRLSQPKSRADELVELRRRLQHSDRPSRVSDEELRLARELRQLRQEALQVLGSVQSCRDCARGHPYPHGRWPGGHCCGGKTSHLFTDDEVACLKAAGTKVWSLRPPRADHAGCSFRGEKGCSLAPADRPNLCVRYTCRQLREELRKRGDLAAVDRIGDQMLLLFRRFVDARERRRTEQLFEGLPTSGGG